MKLQSRLFLTIGIVLALTFVGLEALSYKRLRDDSTREMLNVAEQVHGVLMATRRVYHHQFLNSGIPLTEETLGFLPAHALSRISRDFSNWSDHGLTFNNVSDRPRNPDNAADEIEREALRYFREHPEEQLRFVEFWTIGGPYYHYARPIWVERYCLKCHGKKADAPATIRNTYETSFDYQEGELRGIMSIKIPAGTLSKQVLTRFLQNMLIHLGVFLLVFLLLGLTLRRHVTRPLSSLNAALGGVAAGNHFQTLDGLPEEFARIGGSVDAMVTDIRRQQETLRTDHERFLSITRSVSDAIVAADAQGNVVFWNRGAETMFGHAEEEMMGQPLTRLMPERHREDHRRGLEKARTTGEYALTGHTVELTGLRKSGEEFPLEISLSGWTEGKTPYFSAVIRDITVRKQSEEKL